MTTRLLHICCAALGLAAAATAGAQFKYTDTEGRTTYSDQPAPPSQKVVSQSRLNAKTTPGTPLPFEIQQAVSRYPVTLYTGEKCPPCEEARTYLRTRGVPFTEKTVTSDDDIALFRQQSPDGTAPVVLVGTRKSVGFAPTTWSALLDAAGYPASNGLPRDYQNPIPTALSPTTRAPAQNIAAPAAQASARAPTPTPTAAPQAPPGFHF